MKKYTLVITAVVCAIGVGIAALSTLQHIRIQKEGLEQKSFCSISETIDCDLVSASSYSTFGGIPVAWYGLIAYVIIGAMAVFGTASKKDRRAAVCAAWFISMGAFIYSLRMAYVLVHVLGVLCLECVAMYGINALIFIMLWIYLGISPLKLASFFKNYVRAALGKSSNLEFAPKIFMHSILVVLCFGLGWLIMYGVQAGEIKDPISVGEKLNAYHMESLYAIEPSQEWPVWGNPSAGTAIIEFSDFECPYCRLAAFNIRPYLYEFRKNVKYFFVNYPLDQACNTSLDHPMHKNSCMAAYAAVCAKDRGDFWGFHDDLFRHQKELSPAFIAELVQRHKWDLGEFQTCMDSDETKQRVARDIEVSNKFYIKATPTFLINGRKLIYWRDPQFLRAVVKSEIKKASPHQ